MFNNHFRVDDMETRVTREYEHFDEFIRLTNQTAVEAVLSAEAETKVGLDFRGFRMLSFKFKYFL